MVACRQNGHLVGRMEECILNGDAQDETLPKQVPSLASLLVTGRMKCVIF
jgi:hypothetical protein